MRHEISAVLLTYISLDLRQKDIQMTVQHGLVDTQIDPLSPAPSSSAYLSSDAVVNFEPPIFEKRVCFGAVRSQVFEILNIWPCITDHFDAEDLRCCMFVLQRVTTGGLILS